MWSPWCTEFAGRMKQATGKDLAKQVYDVLGYDHTEKKVRIGALAEATHPQIRDIIEEMLISNKFEPNDAKKVVNTTWRDTPEELDIKLTANVPFLFQKLKKEGVKVLIRYIFLIVNQKVFVKKR